MKLLIATLLCVVEAFTCAAHAQTRCEALAGMVMDGMDRLRDGLPVAVLLVLLFLLSFPKGICCFAHSQAGQFGEGFSM